MLLFYPPYVTPQICLRRMHFLFEQRDRAISTPQFQDCSPPSCPQFNSISASLLLRFCSLFVLFHSSLLVLSSTTTQLQLCCAGKSPLLLTSLNRSSKQLPNQVPIQVGKEAHPHRKHHQRRTILSFFPFPRTSS